MALANDDTYCQLRALSYTRMRKVFTHTRKGRVAHMMGNAAADTMHLHIRYAVYRTEALNVAHAAEIVYMPREGMLFTLRTLWTGRVCVALCEVS